MYKDEINKMISELSGRVRDYYGDALISFVIFGSTAKGTNRPDSDIDCLIIAEKLPKGRMKRVDDFYRNVEKPLEKLISELCSKDIHVQLSPIFKTRQEVELGSPLFLDMVFDAVIAYDRGDFFKDYLCRLKEKLSKLGSKRVMRGNAWYWILKPDYKYGDVIEL
jgi:uncharacterized protein